MPSSSTISNTKMLITRLERLSADSVWAHRASGMRGELMRQLELVEKSRNAKDMAVLETINRAAFRILANAAREIPDPSARIK